MPIWILALWLAAQDQPAQLCTLSGSVVNAVTGAPLAKVELLAQPVDHVAPPASTFTDAKGDFQMVGLPAGKYRLRAHRNGYLETELGARRPGVAGTILVLEAGQELQNLQLKLAPFGVVYGTIRDTDGEPMVAAEVALFRQSFTDTGHREFRAFAELVTDDQGQYRAGDLEPGKYYVKASARSLSEYGFEMPVDHSPKPAAAPPVLLPTFYPGVADPAAARPVEVGTGARVSGVDITLVRSRVFRVTVQASTPGVTLQDAWLFNASRLERFGLQMRTEIRNQAGEFVFNGVPPGSYTLEVRTHEGPRARMPLIVAGDLSGVRLVVGPPAQVTSHITVEANQKVDLAGSRVVFDGGGDENSSDAEVHPNQPATAGLYPGHYQIYFDARSLALTVKSIRLEGEDLFQKGLTIADSSKLSLEIVAAPDGGAVEGVVLGQDEKPAAGATVVLAGAVRSRYDSFHAETTDQYGRYRFENVRPGDYKLFAWEDVEPNAWFDPDFLRDFEARGKSVTLDPNGHSTAPLHTLGIR